MSLKFNVAALLMAGTLVTTFGCSQTPPNGLAPASKSMSATYGLQAISTTAAPVQAAAAPKEQAVTPKEQATETSMSETTDPTMSATEPVVTDPAATPEAPTMTPMPRHKRHHRHHGTMIHVGIKDSIVIVIKGKK